MVQVHTMPSVTCHPNYTDGVLHPPVESPPRNPNPHPLQRKATRDHCDVVGRSPPTNLLVEAPGPPEVACSSTCSH